MKNILSKIIISFVIVAVIAIGLKVSDNILANANASVNFTNDGCGVNTGWIWNGNICVNTCDQNHPWDTYTQRCSGGVGYYTNNNTYNTNCNAYGSNFYFNGTNCVQRTVNPNANYYGNPYNGGTQNPVYGNINYQNLVNNNVYNTGTNYYGNNNVNYPNSNGEIIYYNTYTNSSNNNYINTNPCNYSCYSSSGPKKTEYYIYTITTTTSQTKGTPIYLGNNYSNCNIYCYGSNYYGNTNYSYTNSNYTNYSDGYYYADNSYNGYYDIYGLYNY